MRLSVALSSNAASHTSSSSPGSAPPPSSSASTATSSRRRPDMCGIVGILRWGGAAVRPEEIAAMTHSTIHRGPDDYCAFVEGGLGSGMRRRAIVDLSSGGHQPMFNEDESVAVVFNGELYNHRDLRSRLVVEGHRFRGNSDTEVLVHGYEQLGVAGMLAHLEGMYAFALLDRKRRRLFLARDGFGIKPLYVQIGRAH